jgi:decaprenylphospho-beta-D-ribofuranose 2-oxidase
MTAYNDKIASWSNICNTNTCLEDFLSTTENGLTQPYIPRGSGHSFGDAAFLTDGYSLSSASLNDMGDIDFNSGTCRFGAGVSMQTMHYYLVGQCYEFPIYGGSPHVTLGGAAASDIHGKNHYHEGSFGDHVAALEVWTPQQGLVKCSCEENVDLFRSTIGGMGLTGMIVAVVLRVRPRKYTYLMQKRIRLYSLKEMFKEYEKKPALYQLASWLDLAAAKPVGFFYASCACSDEEYLVERQDTMTLQNEVKIPGLPRVRLITPGVMRFFAKLAELSPKQTERCRPVLHCNYAGPYVRFPQWNLLMGRQGMIEFHFCLPSNSFSSALDQIVADARTEKIALLCAVIKRFGEHEPTGLLSFARAGYGLNFQLRADKRSLDFLSRCSDYLNRIGGRFYLAKDSCLSAEQFVLSCPELSQWQSLVKVLDPYNQVRSDLSQRLQLKPW